jgi:hypothetical protein
MGGMSFGLPEFLVAAIAVVVLVLGWMVFPTESADCSCIGNIRMGTG